MTTSVEEMVEREQWSYQSNNFWYEGEMTVSIHEDGSALVSVEEEQAVDSYNSSFTCSALLPPDKVRELAAVLARAALQPNTGEQA